MNALGRERSAQLAALVRDVPDFPRPGILFKDIMPLLADAAALGDSVRAMAEPYRSDGIRAVAGIESRGFILGAAIAHELGVGFVPVRKARRLPGRTESIEYALEYGTDALEVHADAFGRAERVLVVDDVLATGGTAAAACALLERVGAEVVGLSFLLILEFLPGRSRLARHRVETVLSCER